MYQKKHSLINNKRQPVNLSDGRVIGWLEGETFTKPVCGSKHRLRQPPAWAIDAEAFDQQVKSQAKEIVIWDRESDTKYRASIEDFDQHKGEFDRGSGRQYFLVLPRWEVIKTNGNRPLQLALALEEDSNV
jgi:hypothetical protein